MNFQDRFKGKTSTISKEGIQSVVLSSTIPIKKEPMSASSLSHLPSLYPSNAQDSFSKLPRNYPSSLVSSPKSKPTSSSLAHIPGLNLRNSDNSTPVDQLNHLSDTQKTQIPTNISQYKEGNYRIILPEGQKSLKNQGTPGYYSERILAKREFNPAYHSVNYNRLATGTMLSDAGSGNIFDPNNFFNQHTQLTTLRLPERAATEAMGKPVGTDLRLNRNHLHKKNFENLLSQNKVKQISKEVFKELYNPGYSQRYARKLERDEAALRASRLPRSVQPQRINGGEETTPRIIGDRERYILMASRIPSFETVAQKSLALSKLQYRHSPELVPVSEEVYTRDRQVWTERDAIKRVNSERPSNINIMYVMKPRSEGNILKPRNYGVNMH